jgi:hypothetical protein
MNSVSDWPRLAPNLQDCVQRGIKLHPLLLERKAVFYMRFPAG